MWQAKHTCQPFVLLQYLEFLRKQFSDEKKIHLIVDSYPSHKAKISLAKANELNIELTFIPDGYTDTLQPPDISIFAVLKSIANAKLSHLLLEKPNIHIGMAKSVEILIDSWNQISYETIEKG